MRTQEEEGGARLSDDDKIRVALQVEHFIEIIEKRTGITFAEVVSLVHWARERKDLQNRLSVYAYVSIIGIAITGIAYGVLEGLKHFLNGTHK